MNTLATVRATVSREFSSLLEQEPRAFRLSLNEAEALAWDTGFPGLLFPELAREKARGVAAWHERQQGVREKERSLAFAA